MATKKGENLLYEDLTYKIRKACFKVWKEFGGAFKESIIDRALTQELRKEGLKVDVQKKIPIYYDGIKIGTYIPDKIIDDVILLEVKCKPYLTKEDERQFWLYLKGSNYKLGLLVNFGSDKLEINRRIYDRARKFFRVNPRSYPREAKRSASINKGFTLIEILVSVAVFSLVMAATSGIFVTVLQGQRKSLANQELINNTSYNLEYISRLLRMARKQTAQLPSCLSQNGLNYEITRTGQGIKFLNYQGICYEFYLDAGRMYQKKDTEILPLTPAKIEVSLLKFSLSGASESDNLQPRLTFALAVNTKGQRPEEKAEIKVQTTVSQRELDTR